LTAFKTKLSHHLTGHYGTVTLGVWKANGSEVAVKEIDKSKYSSLVALRNEVRIMQVSGNCLRPSPVRFALFVLLQSLKHPYIIHLMDMFETEKHMYLVRLLAGV